MKYILPIIIILIILFFTILILNHKYYFSEDFVGSYDQNTIEDLIPLTYVPSNPYLKEEMTEYEIIDIYKKILNRPPTLDEIKLKTYQPKDELTEELYNSYEYEKMTKVQDNMAEGGIESSIAKRNLLRKIIDMYKKKYNKDTFNRLYSLLEERKNKLYTEINKIINKIVEVYNDKHIFIIGYNERWKNKVNLGTDTNKKFYQIPYRYILDKLQNKLENLGKQLIITEESYTSKCDALTLEEIKKKDKYNGKRSLRGLYISGNGKAINADLNGAINIMRKKYELTKITGHNIYCPEIIQIP